VAGDDYTSYTTPAWMTPADMPTDLTPDVPAATAPESLESESSETALEREPMGSYPEPAPAPAPAARRPPVPRSNYPEPALEPWPRSSMGSYPEVAPFGGARQPGQRSPMGNYAQAEADQWSSMGDISEEASEAPEPRPAMGNYPEAAPDPRPASVVAQDLDGLEKELGFLSSGGGVTADDIEGLFGLGGDGGVGEFGGFGGDYNPFDDYDGQGLRDGARHLISHVVRPTAMLTTRPPRQSATCHVIHHACETLDS